MVEVVWYDEVEEVIVEFKPERMDDGFQEPLTPLAPLVVVAMEDGKPAASPESPLSIEFLGTTTPTLPSKTWSGM